MNSKKISNLNDEEKSMMRYKYAAPKIGKMSEDELRMNTKALLLRIHVITGWTLPTQEILNILKDQFYKKLVEDYQTLNTEEIEYAFRQAGTSIEDWGKEMNLNLLDKILRPYVVKRYEISQKEEMLLPAPPPKMWSDEDILNQYRSEIEAAYQGIRRGHQPIIHKYFEQTLRDDDLLNEGENISEFLVRKLNAAAGNIYVKE